MGIRTGAEYIEGLRSRKREVWLGVFRNLKMQKNAALRYTALFIFMQFGQRFLMSLTPPLVEEERQ
jgi:hypothetical protein